MTPNLNKTLRDSKKSSSLIVVTGGPGAGKTSLIEAAKKEFCSHISLLPESATIVFGGGFWRKDTPFSREAAQRAIYHVQREMEKMALYDTEGNYTLCDRGTLDGLAYWPGERESFFKTFGTTEEAELSRYAAVIHLSVPDEMHGYNTLTNPVRNETAAEAMALDFKILNAWKNHPNLIEINSRASFHEKMGEALEVIRRLIPPCCVVSDSLPTYNSLQMPTHQASIS